MNRDLSVAATHRTSRRHTYPRGALFDNNARIDLTCPNCQHRWAVRLGNLRRTSVRCPACDGEIDTGPFAKQMDDAEKRLKRGFG